MDKLEYLLVQRIEHDETGETLDLSWLVEAIYIETIDLSGPRLIIRINDRESIIRDDIGLKEWDSLTVTLADPYIRGGIDIQETFVVQTMPVGKDETITLNCLSGVIHNLKLPAKDPLFFVQEPLSALLEQFMPGLTYNANTFPANLDWHLLPAMRPSRLLRQAAKELGIQLFYRRGEVVCKPLSELTKQTPAYEYHYNDESQPNQIAGYQQISATTLIDDRMRRNYQGWSLTDGHVLSGMFEGEAAELAGLENPLNLDNLSKAPVPVLDMYCLGNGGLRAGDTLGLTWNRMNIEMPLDESLPEKVIIGTVAHRYAANRYQCRIKAVTEYSA